jgi:hypothetical protein
MPGICLAALVIVRAHAQSPTAAVSASPALTGSGVGALAPLVSATSALTGTAGASPSPIAAASPTPSLLKKVGVKIQFLPPPMEGTISLGIYDSHGKLVRVLHKGASADEFVAALDGFITHWDGLDDNGKPMPPGHYEARGYMVGAVKVRYAPASLTGSTTFSTSIAAPSPGGTDSSPVYRVQDVQLPDGKPSFVPPSQVRVSLIDNPLNRDRAGSADVTVGLDTSGCWLKLADGLPLLEISSIPGAPGNGDWAVISRAAPGQPLRVLVNMNGDSRVDTYTITNISDMMAFDCGGFDFAGVGKW